jgi:predicted MFS family arabinose efflux permease
MPARTEDTSTAHEPTTDWLVVAVAMLVAVVAAGHVGKLPPALPLIRADLDLDIVTAGWLASTFSTTGMFTAIVFGTLVSRFNPWLTALAGLSLLTISGGAGSFATSANELLLSRFFEGLGFLATVISAPTLIASATTGRSRGLALGLFSAYMPVGVSLMMMIAPVGFYFDGWRSLWILTAIITLAATVITAVMYAVRPDTARPRTSAWNMIGSALAQPGPWLIAGCFALYGSQLYAVITWMPTFILEQRGGDPGLASAATVAIVVVNSSCSFICGWMLHRGANTAVVVLAAGAAMAAFGCAAFMPELPDLVRYACIVTVCGAGGFIAAASFAAAPQFASVPAQTGVLNGLIVQASNVAQFTGPTSVAVAISWSGGWRGPVWFFVIASVLIMLLAVLLLRHKRQP